MTGAKPFGFQRVMGLDPVEWVLSMMADPDRWRHEPGLIRVTHVGLREAAQLPADKDRYSWDELSKHAGLAAAMEKVHEKVRADREAKLDPIEREVSGLEDTLGILDSVFTLSGHPGGAASHRPARRRGSRCATSTRRTPRPS